MTNLDIIKYLAYENPKRLAQLLNDIYDVAYTDGYNDDIDAWPNFEKWISEDASKCKLYSDEELAEWVRPIDYPVIEIAYPDNLVIELPFEGKDPNHMWNTDNNYNIISNAINEIKLLENVIEATKHDDIEYVRFRHSACAYCSDPNCMRSQTEICDCHKFKSYEAREGKQ